ncbi:hypothetical protein M8998_02900 [Sphingobacterium sp. lm-10]|uniref:hypothetical protein n=1 Tax=Sphingobacterium sp. lm-10 TaxID=2944904 RepID=UPI002021A166|nr:hypothetical protein [Sphingobacterium sp. lm-10]MCL7986884.1 hypothetical protein [Sphingobacterium sp. lm-10]
MKRLLSLPLALCLLMMIGLSYSTTIFAQEKSEEHRIQEHIGKLVLSKKKKKVFQNKGRDSTITVRIDTLIMKDRASLQFYGLKDVKLEIGYAEIGKDVVFSGIGNKNNASNFDISVNLAKFQSMYVIARGIDAMNGTRTNPNGDGGNVTFHYATSGLTPQQEDRKAKQYLTIDVSPGGRRVNPPTDIALVMSRIGMGGPRLGGIPQGQVYSGSPGREGKVVVEAAP